jgi:hypothetical protein
MRESLTLSCRNRKHPLLHLRRVGSQAGPTRRQENRGGGVYCLRIEFPVSPADARVSHRPQVGQPTILVNNAGVVMGKLLLDLSEEDIRRYVRRTPLWEPSTADPAWLVLQDVWCQRSLSLLDHQGVLTGNDREGVRSHRHGLKCPWHDGLCSDEWVVASFEHSVLNER